MSFLRMAALTARARPLETQPPGRASAGLTVKDEASGAIYLGDLLFSGHVPVRRLQSAQRPSPAMSLSGNGRLPRCTMLSYGHRRAPSKSNLKTSALSRCCRRLAQRLAFLSHSIVTVLKQSRPLVTMGLAVRGTG